LLSRHVCATPSLLFAHRHLYPRLVSSSSSTRSRFSSSRGRYASALVIATTSIATAWMTIQYWSRKHNQAKQAAITTTTTTTTSLPKDVFDKLHAHHFITKNINELIDELHVSQLASNSPCEDRYSITRIPERQEVLLGVYDG